VTTNGYFTDGTSNPIPAQYLGTPPQPSGDIVDPSVQRRNQVIYDYLKNNRRATRRTSGLGTRLPSVGGLRLKRGVKTKYGIRDVVTDASGMVYGYANPAANLAIGRAGNPGSQYLALTRRGAKPVPLRAAPVAGTPGSPGSATTGGASNIPASDDFAGYGDYPMIATYLRGLQAQEKNFAKDFQTNVLPGVSGGLQNIANIGANIAAQYGGSVGTGTGGGYVTNAANVAAGIAPTQVAGGLGGATQTYNPNAQAAGSARASSMGASAAADSRYNTLLAAQTPVSQTQGILSGLTSQAMNISKSYADKRMTERLKLDQWIVEQKQAAAELETKNTYNKALLEMSGIKLDETIRSNRVNEGIAQQNADTARTVANNAGQMTDVEIGDSKQGWIRVPPGAGPKNVAIINKTVVISKDGNQWYRPKSAGGLSPEQTKLIVSAKKSLTENYYGAKYDTTTNVLSPGSGGINSLESPESQGQRIAAAINEFVNSGELPKSYLTKANMRKFINGAMVMQRSYKPLIEGADGKKVPGPEVLMPQNGPEWKRVIAAALSSIAGLRN